LALLPSEKPKETPNEPSSERALSNVSSGKPAIKEARFTLNSFFFVSFSDFS
jgi:hypothetical protein